MPTNRASTGAAAAALGLLLLAPVALGTPADARRAMEQNDFGRALRLYEKLLEDSPEDAWLHYNAGAAAYGAGDFEKARNYFNSTLASPDAPPRGPVPLWPPVPTPSGCWVVRTPNLGCVGCGGCGGGVGVWRG